MKNLLATLFLLVSYIPAVAAPRDDTDSGMGLGGTLLFFAVLIIWMIASIKNENKKQ